MIDFADIEHTLNARGVYFTQHEYHFALDIIIGTERRVSYAINLDTEEYDKVKGTEDEKDYFAKCEHNAVTLLEKQHIKQLVDELKYRWHKSIQDAALNLDDIELSGSDIKKVLATFLRDRIDDPASASVKELVDLLKMYQPYLPDDSAVSEFQRHFIQVHDPFNALCTNCNHEMQVVKGLTCVCPTCGAKYGWYEDEDRFRPMPAKI